MSAKDEKRPSLDNDDDWETFKEKYPKIWQKAFDEGKDSVVCEGGEKKDKEKKEQLNQQFQQLAKDNGGTIMGDMSENKRNVTDDDVKQKALDLWNSDADLRSEFEGDQEAWVSYCQAESRGQIRILGGIVK